MTERIKLLLDASISKLKQIDEILLGTTTTEPLAIPTEEDVKTCTQPEAAIRLGVSRSTIHRMMKDGRLQCVVLNKNPRILLSSIFRYGCNEQKSS